jgi:hypothetical protein
MGTDQVQSSVPAPPAPQEVQTLQAWLARLGLSGKVLAVGGFVGVVAVFLPLMSMSLEIQIPGGANLFGANNAVSLPGVSSSQSVMVVRDFRGILCLVGYLASLALAYVLYPANGLAQKNLGWAVLGVGALLTLLALWLLVGALNGSGGLGGIAAFKVSVGFGAILNLLAAMAVTAGGFLKAREEKLI